MGFFDFIFGRKTPESGVSGVEPEKKLPDFEVAGIVDEEIEQPDFNQIMNPITGVVTAPGRALEVAGTALGKATKTQFLREKSRIQEQEARIGAGKITKQEALGEDIKHFGRVQLEPIKGLTRTTLDLMSGGLELAIKSQKPAAQLFDRLLGANTAAGIQWADDKIDDIQEQYQEFLAPDKDVSFSELGNIAGQFVVPYAGAEALTFKLLPATLTKVSPILAHAIAGVTSDLALTGALVPSEREEDQTVENYIKNALLALGAEGLGAVFGSLARAGVEGLPTTKAFIENADEALKNIETKNPGFIDPRAIGEDIGIVKKEKKAVLRSEYFGVTIEEDAIKRIADATPVAKTNKRIIELNKEINTIEKAILGKKSVSAKGKFGAANRKLLREQGGETLSTLKKERTLLRRAESITENPLTNKELKKIPELADTIGSIAETKKSIKDFEVQHLSPLAKEAKALGKSRIDVLTHYSKGIPEAEALVRSYKSSLNLVENATQELNRIVKEARSTIAGSEGVRAASKAKPSVRAKQPKTTAKKQPITPETKVRGLAKGIEQKAIEEKLVTSFADLPEYKTVKVEDQARLATEIINEDWDKAVRIAMGEEIPDKGILPESLLVAVEKRALEVGDVDTLRKLATSSNLVDEATTMGQRLRLLAERNPESPVANIQKVAKDRSDAFETRTGKKPTAAKKKFVLKIRDEVEVIQKEIELMEAKKTKKRLAIIKKIEAQKRREVVSKLRKETKGKIKKTIREGLKEKRLVNREVKKEIMKSKKLAKEYIKEENAWSDFISTIKC